MLNRNSTSTSTNNNSCTNRHVFRGAGRINGKKTGRSNKILMFTV